MHSYSGLVTPGSGSPCSEGLITAVAEALHGGGFPEDGEIWEHVRRVQDWTSSVTDELTRELEEVKRQLHREATERKQLEAATHARLDAMTRAVHALVLQSQEVPTNKPPEPLVKPALKQAAPSGRIRQKVLQEMELLQFRIDKLYDANQVSSAAIDSLERQADRVQKQHESLGGTQATQSELAAIRTRILAHKATMSQRERLVRAQQTKTEELKARLAELSGMPVPKPVSPPNDLQQRYDRLQARLQRLCADVRQSQV